MALRLTLRKAILLGTMVVLLTAPTAIYSCGPFLSSEVFAFEDQPDGPAPDFAAGKLGIVRPSFRISYLVVAYRYFSGRKLTAAQQKAAVDVWNRDVVPEHPNEEQSAADWAKARNGIPNLPAPPEISPYASGVPDDPYFQYVNCPGDAFQNAVKTLHARSTKLTSADLLEWISGQDQVFANCRGARVIPAALETGEPLLRADRTYQIAAAHFYARDFDEAAKQFEAISKDDSSPWASISPYLVARALVRKANLVHQQSEPFDRPTMVAAQHRLESIIGDRQGGPVHDPATRLLNYVLFRTEPTKRVEQLDDMILRSGPDANFKQDLWDYALLLSQGEQSGDPSDWVRTFHILSGYPNAVLNQQSEAAKHALDQWRSQKSLPWLIAALAGAKAGSPDVQALLRAADQVPASAYAYLTVRYYALRLRLGAAQTDPARKELDSLLARSGSETPLGSRNLLNDERLKISTSLDDFLAHAPETPVPSQLDMNTGDTVPADPDEAKPGEPLFNHYAAEVFLKRLPLSALLKSAASSAVPKNLRREIARSAWVRSVLVGDLEAAGKFQPLLQELDLPLWKSMEPFRTAQNDAAKQFSAIFVILNNPGMKPSVRESSLRSATLAEIDNFRDNWWCNDMDAGANWGKVYSEYDKNVNLKFEEHDPTFPFPTWVSESEKAAAASEWKKLAGAGTGPNYLTNQVLDYAKQHLADPRVPQALYLAVRSTHYGCTNVETTKRSKAAFDFLHEHYPQSEWAAKTKYYY